MAVASVNLCPNCCVSCTTVDPDRAPDERWNAGDSTTAAWPSFSKTPPYNAALDGNGFITERFGTVESYTLFRIASERSGTNLMVVTLGVNDRLHPLADRLSAMAPFGSTRARPFHADCAPVAEPFGTSDGPHPSIAGLKAHAACIDAAFPLG